MITPMSERSPSRTALRVAALRAAHAIVDTPPLILDDPVAARLLDPAAVAGIADAAERLRHPAVAALRSHLLLRSRFAEDCLAEAFARGIRQYVLLGAGFDTFAYRQPAWAAALRIFEVDHPASRRSKLDRLATRGIPVPPNVAHVASDLETDSLGRDLERAGFDAGQAAFFSCLGVLVYLDRDAADRMLRYVAARQRGSEIVLTFTRDPDDPDSPAARAGMAERAAGAGEPWRTFFRPDDVDGWLRGCGFADVTVLDPDEAAARYFAGRTDDLRAPTHASIVRARV